MIAVQGMDALRPCHMVAMPYPGRGHINSLMNLCKLLVSKMNHIFITFVVTEEWLGFIGSDPKPDRIRFGSIPNVIPSESVRAADLPGFMEAVATNMEAPFEQLLDRLEPPAPCIIMADTFLLWAFRVGNRRNIPVAALWPMSATSFLVFRHFDLFFENGHYPIDYSGGSHERVNYIPGVASMTLVDLPPRITGTKEEIFNRVLEMYSWIPKAHCVLLPTIYELEPNAVDALKQTFKLPIYSICAETPCFNLGYSPERASNADINYQRWLDCQPSRSVLYVSFGSFLSLSIEQMDEIAAGLCKSGVRFLWPVRGETKKLKEACGDMGLVVPWCNQFSVLCHSSIGGFWTHCGWNSVREGVLAGVPFLTFPIAVDQFPNQKLIVEDWKVGWRVKEESNVENLMKRGEIARLVQRFMDLGSNEGEEMRRRAKELQEICLRSISEGGSCQTNINSFIRDVSLSLR